MEYVKVTYAGARPVNIDGAAAGTTNQVFQVDAGTHKFDLGAPADYDPPSQNILISGTSLFQPKIVVFNQRKN